MRGEGRLPYTEFALLFFLLGFKACLEVVLGYEVGGGGGGTLAGEVLSKGFAGAGGKINPSCLFTPPSPFLFFPSLHLDLYLLVSPAPLSGKGC